MSDIPHEVEAKLLAADETVLEQIATLRHLGPYTLGRRPTVELHTTYLDTAGFLLARSGVALRLRRIGADEWEVSTKGQGQVKGAIHARPERTVVLPSAPTFPFVPPPELADGLPAGTTQQTLAPILISEVDRRLLALTRAAQAPGPALAELALDNVRYRDPKRPERALATFYEVEVELEAGTRDELQQISRLLQARFPLRPALDNKLHRGLALVYGPGVWKVPYLSPRPATV